MMLKMKQFLISVLAGAAISNLGLAQTYLQTGATSFNGKIKYFIADLAPSFPCHSMYEYDMTYFNMATDESNWNAIATILESL